MDQPAVLKKLHILRHKERRHPPFEDDIIIQTGVKQYHKNNQTHTCHIFEHVLTKYRYNPVADHN